MTKDTLKKMLAGLDETEKAATLNELGITDAATVAELTASTQAPAGVAVQAPVMQQPEPQAPVSSPVEALQNRAAAAGVDTNALQQQLATERTARITAECDSFIAANASKITPAEAADAKKLYAQLAGLEDQTALNQYKAAVQARPANPMLQEQVAAGQLNVLGNGTADTRTETEKDAALVETMLGMTQDGQTAAKAMKAGDGNLSAAFRQFAVNQ